MIKELEMTIAFDFSIEEVRVDCKSMKQNSLKPTDSKFWCCGIDWLLCRNY